MCIQRWKLPERSRQNNSLTGGNMTKKEFKAAMLRGLGRCVSAVQMNPEKYRDIVLWACKKDFAYDAQSEATRSWYVYAMACAYPDKETFIDAAAEALRKYRSCCGWDLLHLSEILMFFASDGYGSAGQALEAKYQEVLAAMFARKRRPSRVFHEISDLEQLGLVLTIDLASFLRVAKDFGKLYRERSYMEDGDFAWFFASKGERYRKTLEQVAEKDEDIACFLRREQAFIEKMEKNREQRKSLPPKELGGVELSRWLAKKADQETVMQHVHAYLEQSQPELRAQALEAFRCCPYPDDPLPILDDTRSDCEKLRDVALTVLENVRHPVVRSFALDQIANGIRSPENFALLVTNYKPEDGPLLEELLRDMIAAKDWDSVHSAGMDIFRTFYKGRGIPHPKHLLPLLYEYDPCSFCRESVIQYMSKHRMLTKKMLEECLFDSNEDIRRFAAKRLKK